MATVSFGKSARQCLAVASIVIGGFSAALPSPFCNYGIALATGLNAAALYLLKEETPVAKAASEENAQAK
jgi:hypothetical protein